MSRLGGQRQAQWSAEAKQLEAEVTLKQKQLNYWQGALPSLHLPLQRSGRKGLGDGAWSTTWTPFAGKKAAVEAEEKLEREKAEAVRLATEAKAAAAATCQQPSC